MTIACISTRVMWRFIAAVLLSICLVNTVVGDADFSGIDGNGSVQTVASEAPVEHEAADDCADCADHCRQCHVGHCSFIMISASTLSAPNSIKRVLRSRETSLTSVTIPQLIEPPSV